MGLPTQVETDSVAVVLALTGELGDRSPAGRPKIPTSQSPAHATLQQHGTYRLSMG